MQKYVVICRRARLFACGTSTYYNTKRELARQQLSFLSFVAYFRRRPLKVSRVASAKKKKKRNVRGTWKSGSRSPERAEERKGVGFLNEKYRVKLSLRLLLPNRLSPVLLPSRRRYATLSGSHPRRVELNRIRGFERPGSCRLFFQATSSRAEMLLV